MKKNSVLIFDSIKVNCSFQKALETIHKIDNIEVYEPKLTKANITRLNDNKGFYSTKGYFAGIPWQGKFSYEITENGFYSELLESHIPGLKVVGGFIVEEINNKTNIIHYEKYELPFYISFISPLLKQYIQISMKNELNTLKDIILSNSNNYKYFI